MVRIITGLNQGMKLFNYPALYKKIGNWSPVPFEKSVTNRQLL
jgi:hypothetical protein